MRLFFFRRLKAFWEFVVLKLDCTASKEIIKIKTICFSIFGFTPEFKFNQTRNYFSVSFVRNETNEIITTKTITTIKYQLNIKIELKFGLFLITLSNHYNVKQFLSLITLVLFKVFLYKYTFNTFSEMRWAYFYTQNG